MYTWMLIAHSWWRWGVVLLAVVVLVRLLFMRGAWRTWEEHALRFFPIALDVQVLLGVVLFAVNPLTGEAMRSGTLFANEVARFWSMEHALPMVLALVLAHVGQKRLRAALAAGNQSSRAGRWLLIGAILLLLASIPWPVMPNGRPLFRV